MKRILLSMLSLFVLNLLSAQIEFSDDFESYQSGDLIGTKADWTTWSGAGGGADDASVSDEEAHSGSNALKLTSFQDGGGPSDIVLPFKGVYSSGGFTFSMWMYVVGGTGAYFNFQTDQVVGTNWAQETHFTPDGAVSVNSNNTQYQSGSYPQDQWFLVEWLLDLDNNKWELIVDGQCLGFFTNNWNRVASINIYPVSDNNQAVYFIDDVYFKHDPNGLPAINVDAGVSGINLKAKAVAGTSVPIGANLQNAGSEDITSFKVLYDDGTNTSEKEFTGLSVASGDSYAFDLDVIYEIPEGPGMVSIQLLEVNGNQDERDCNDVAVATVDGVVPALHKKVLVEEATGTWCTWCPRGDVFVRWMTGNYPDHFIAMALHRSNGPALDPMENLGHFTLASNAAPGFTGFPQMLIARKEWFGFGVIEDVENRFYTDLAIDADAYVDPVGAQYSESTETLDVSTNINFFGGTGGNYNVDVFLVESNINKDSAYYHQVNIYSGGRQGPMGGYENLPNPVPAKDMTYNHVSRGSFSNYSGQTVSGVLAGSSKLLNFKRSFKAGHDIDDFDLVVVILNADGTVNNVEEVSLQEAMDNGFEDASSSSEDLIAVEGATFYPNPTSNQTFVKMNLSSPSEVTISIIDATGKGIDSHSYGKFQGPTVLPINFDNVSSGIYEVQIQVGDEYKTQTIQVIK